MPRDCQMIPLASILLPQRPRRDSTSGDIFRHAAAKSRRRFWPHTCFSVNAIRNVCAVVSAFSPKSDRCHNVARCPVAVTIVTDNRKQW